MHPEIDMDQIARQSIQPVQAFLVPSLLKQDKKDRLQWKPHYELIDFGLPVPVSSPAIKKKFKILIECYDSEAQKSFSKTIFFGDESDYIFTGDKSTRLKKISGLKYKNNPLHPDYWRAHLCLASVDFKLNCKKMMDFLIQKRFPKTLKQSNDPTSHNQSKQVKKKQT